MRQRLPVEILKRKKLFHLDGIANTVKVLLDNIQQAIFKKAQDYRDAHITNVDTWEEFEKLLDTKVVSLLPIGMVLSD